MADELKVQVTVENQEQLHQLKSTLQELGIETEKFDVRAKKTSSSVERLGKKMTELNVRTIAAKASITTLLFSLVRLTIAADETAKKFEELDEKTSKNIGRWGEFKTQVVDTTHGLSILLGDVMGALLRSFDDLQAKIRGITIEQLAEERARARANKVTDEEIKLKEELKKKNEQLAQSMRQMTLDIESETKMLDVQIASLGIENEERRKLFEINAEGILQKQQLVEQLTKEGFSQEQIAKILELVNLRIEKNIELVQQQREEFLRSLSPAEQLREKLERLSAMGIEKIRVAGGGFVNISDVEVKESSRAKTARESRK